MGHDAPAAEPLAIHVDEDGALWIDVGSRLVRLEDDDDLERILDRLAAERGRLRLVPAAGHADDEDEPSTREAAAAAEALAALVAAASERGIEAVVEEDARR